MELRFARKMALWCCVCICFFSACVLVAGSCRLRDIGSSEMDSDNQGWRKGGGAEARRKLGGLGSHPPRCQAKCGRCKPCRPVHVTVPPGSPVTEEYYPEAWRCKCGNRYYMPWRG